MTKEHDRLSDLFEMVITLLKDYDSYAAVREVCRSRGFTKKKLQAIEADLVKRLDKLDEKEARSEAIHALDLIEREAE